MGKFWKETQKIIENAKIGGGGEQRMNFTTEIVPFFVKIQEGEENFQESCMFPIFKEILFRNF